MRLICSTDRPGTRRALRRAGVVDLAGIMNGGAGRAAQAGYALRALAVMVSVAVWGGLGVQGQSTNSWVAPGSGKWEISSNWSLGSPMATDTILVTNSGTKTVTIDATTSASFSNTLTVTNLTLGAPSNSVNTLFLSNAGSSPPLHVQDYLTLLAGGVLSASNSTLQMDNGTAPIANADNGSDVQIDGTVAFNGSVFNGSNAYSIALGYTHTGSLNLTNSIFTVHSLSVGYWVDGTANFVNSTSRLGYGIGIGDVGGTTGTMLIQGGQFIATNTWYAPDETLLFLGDRGAGYLTVRSNAFVQIGSVVIGSIGGSSGTMTIQSGDVTLGKTYLAESVEQPNYYAVTGTIAQLGGTVSMAELHIGCFSNCTGTVSLSGGVLSNALTTVAETNGAFGSLTVSGGTNFITSSLLVGTDFSSGQVSVLSGALIVTNSGHTALAFFDHSSLLLGSGTFLHDNLTLTNNSTVVVLTNLFVASGVGATSSVSVAAGSAFIASSNLVSAASSNSVATFTISGASLVVSNTFGLANDGTTSNGLGSASATVSNATVSAGSVVMGSSAGGVGALTMLANSQLNVNSNLTVISGSINTPSALTVGAGGSLNVPNGNIAIGSSGSGLMTNYGNVTAQTIALGGPGSSGVAYQYSGFISVHLLTCNQWDGRGGDMDGNGGTIIMGAAGHSGSYSLDAGNSTNWGSVVVGQDPGLAGYYTNDGGVMSVTGNMTIGNCANNASGTAVVSGTGMLFVTNASGTAVLDIQQGTFILAPGGTLTVDILRVHSGCNLGTFLPAGGTIHYRQLDLDPAQSAIGDGIPTGWKQQYGFDPLDPTVAGADPDQDGRNNLSEYLAGTDPTNAASVLRLIDVVRINSQDLRVDWLSEGGHNYVIQTNSDLRGGAFNDLFTTAVPAAGPGEGTTSYIDAGGAQRGTRYYRMRLQLP